MPFGDFKTLGDAIRHLHVTEVREDFVQLHPVPVSDFLRVWLEESQTQYPLSASEWAVCESLIFPVLREVHSPYCKELVLWSHTGLYRGEELLGFPDYMIAKRSPLSVEVMELPYVLIMEAKRNDFDWGWAQCLAAMCAAQGLNGGPPERVIYGVVSDGFMWRFGKLQGRTFCREQMAYSLGRLDELCAALNYVLEMCRQQALIPVEAA
jgi:hypothetical protein